MYHKESTAIAYPNIAFIKYWGDRDPNLHIPANGSISMNLGDLQTQTQVVFDQKLSKDEFFFNGSKKEGNELDRVRIILNQVRNLSNQSLFAHVDSQNNFPTGVGIASSASGFAALSMAASYAAGLQLTEAQLSRLARLGSGSACRSVPDGFVEWLAGEDDHSSYAVSIAKHDHWGLIDCIAVVNQTEKTIPSLNGHSIAQSSPLQTSRLEGSRQRLDICRQAIVDQDFDKLAEISELDSNLMHAVMLTSSPSLIYWEPATIALMKAVPIWRKEGLPVFFTIDAGPNVHIICIEGYEEKVQKRILEIPGVQEVFDSRVGGATKHIQNSNPF
jgi:diphosphomevalonate decarboxylase